MFAHLSASLVIQSPALFQFYYLGSAVYVGHLRIQQLSQVNRQVNFTIDFFYLLVFINSFNHLKTNWIVDSEAWSYRKTSRDGPKLSTVTNVPTRNIYTFSVSHSTTGPQVEGGLDGCPNIHAICLFLTTAGHG